ncbi:dUTP diphosphatase [Pseudodesulfovibrio piezophilus]|uniref:dUTP diphosphatase n=1 Tax=Pseudodesulfovibrio piezophilus (strain DSM 21447 / JCM 15486 / C1TLV30) TaxID=1322246 RepID=M1WUQ4_PSEP2|nr:dUTP diphosphatase [Pseudodesulfovibrio piezophilus]CCH47743.1 Deoxyuridine 5'-triphosphate nucleotidohydrolase [Pseudodesulfovibrio piezophilus C1TLV30]
MRKIDVDVKFIDDMWADYDLEYATEFSAGLDLRACLKSSEIEIAPGKKAAISAGISIEIHEKSVAAYIFSRSGLGTKEGLTISQGVGVIDPDYRGEIKVSLLNTSDRVRRIKRGQRIAQMIFMPIFQAVINPVQELNSTKRGEGGFGSTGKL